MELEQREVSADLQRVIDNRLSRLDLKMASLREKHHATKEITVAKLLEESALRCAQIQDEIDALRQEVKDRPANRIEELSEAILIAKFLEVNSLARPITDASSRYGIVQIIRTEAAAEGALYFMGAEALSVERSVLSTRQSDDFTEPRIAELQSELGMLRVNGKVEILLAREGEYLYLAGLAEIREETARLREVKLDAKRLHLVRLEKVVQRAAFPRLN